jgi:FkbM family methyltransferase
MNATVGRGLFGGFLRRIWCHLYFKFVLANKEQATVDGVVLDLSCFSPRIRNRIANLGYEAAERLMCEKFLNASDSILEVGGGIGFIGIYCQKKLGIKNYVSVEANPATVDILKRNYKLNELEPTVWNLALARNDGIAELNVGGDFWGHNVVQGGQRDRSKIIRVNAVTLSTLFGFLKGPANVLIMDVEGAEQLVDFAQLPPMIEKIIIEVHPSIIGEEATSEVLCTLKEMGFQTVHCEENTFALVRR